MAKQQSFDFCKEKRDWSSQYSVSRAEIARHYGVAVNTIKGRELSFDYPKPKFFDRQARYYRDEIERYFESHPFNEKAQEAANRRPYKEARGNKSSASLAVIRAELRDIYQSVGELLRKTDLAIERNEAK